MSNPPQITPADIIANYHAQQAALAGTQAATSVAAGAAGEAMWLVKNPQFKELPASIEEFLGPEYLNVRRHTRRKVLEALKDIFGEEPQVYNIAKYTEAIATGGIGWGKSTIASIALVYMVHWLLCLKDPQEFFDLMPGSRIAVMMMSTSAPQARNVIFSDVKARIDNSPWFKMHPYDDKYKLVLKFENDIVILPGDSGETTFEGYNILCGVIDEIDSHKVTADKDYAEQGYTTISARMYSRFGDRGFVFCVGQTKYTGSFADRHFTRMKNDPNAYAVKLALWESLGWDKFLKADGTRDSFFYDVKRKRIMSKELAAVEHDLNNLPEHVMEVPQKYRRQFENDPVKALRDLAGVPPSSEDSFIILDYKIDEARQRWLEWRANKYPMAPNEWPVRETGAPEPWLRATDSIPRFIHLDIGVTGDALGMAMGHIAGYEVIDGENKPRIIIDALWRIVPPVGGAIELATVRAIIYELRDRRGYVIKKVTSDSFQSTDMLQQLKSRGFATDILSVDKDITPYYDTREALYEDRIAIPVVMSRLQVTGEPVDVALKEFKELRDLGVKIDHPPNGSKDVTDACAGVVSSCAQSARTGNAVGTGPVAIPRAPDVPSLSRKHRTSSLRSSSVPFRPPGRR